MIRRNWIPIQRRIRDVICKELKYFVFSSSLLRGRGFSCFRFSSSSSSFCIENKLSNQRDLDSFPFRCVALGIRSTARGDKYGERYDGC